MQIDPPIERRGYYLTEVLRRAAAVTTYAGIARESGSPVVLKELRIGALNAWKEHDLFRREVDVLAAVRHDGVPRVLETFEEEDGAGGMRVCLVMQRVPGESLDARLARGAPFEEGDVRRVLEGVLEILAHLHSLAPPIVHRDIKPANIVMDDARVFLVDFGGVRRFLPWAKGGSTVIGTFGYMAPEQLHGDAAPVSDLYGLGATLAGCEASDLPRKGLRVDVAAIPAAREPLRTVVTRLLEPEPDARYGSAREALSALRDANTSPSPASDPRSSALPMRVEDGGAHLVHAARERLPEDPRAQSHWKLLAKIRRGLLVAGTTGFALGLLFQALRGYGASGWWFDTARGLFGMSALIVGGSFFVRTRPRMVRKLLELGRRRKGKLTVADVSIALRLDPVVARDLLEHLIDLDMARRDPDREGGYLILAS
jgi:serine/threonine protein kinase